MYVCSYVRRYLLHVCACVYMLYVLASVRVYVCTCDVFHMYVRAFVRSLAHAACMRVRLHVVRIYACTDTRMYTWLRLILYVFYRLCFLRLLPRSMPFGTLPGRLAMVTPLGRYLWPLSGGVDCFASRRESILDI
jgi:hypothetical protein